MSRLTTEERRRVCLARQQAHQAQLRRRARTSVRTGPSGRAMLWALGTMMLGMALVGGLRVAEVSISLPDSMIEALLPRV
jgi:hypothetical protein